MAITFRHQAAGVVPPSNASTRKYGQSLVLQQQQQKYQGQQAGYDRLFTLGRDQQRDQFQLTRDMQRNSDQAARDKMLFEQNQQMAEADRQRGFMDEARKASSGIIMEDIQNGAYDPATARKLQQNLVAEAEALGNPNLDATQRAEALAKIRAERALLTANRMEPTPPPSDQDRINSGTVVVNGVAGQLDKDGIFKPFPKEELPPQEPSRPTSVDDAIAADRSAYDAILKQEIEAITSDDEALTPEKLDKARERARLQYEKELGLGTPTAAPELPGASPQGAVPDAPMQSILETPQAAAPSAGIPVAAPDPGQPPRPPAGIPVAPPDPGQPPAPQSGASNPWSDVASGDTVPREPMPLTNSPSQNSQQSPDMGVRDKMESEGYQLKTLPDGSTYYERDDRPEAKANRAKQQQAGEITGQAASAAMSAPQQAQGGLPKAAKPNFGKLVSGAVDDIDRSLVTSLQGIYAKQSPDVQNAIGVVLGSENLGEIKAAKEYLKSNGIDVDQMTSPPSPPISADKHPYRMGNQGRGM